jgi:hypothetical protein
MKRNPAAWSPAWPAAATIFRMQLPIPSRKPSSYGDALSNCQLARREMRAAQVDFAG